MRNLIWPLLILLGLIAVLGFDQGEGLSSPFFWLIPIGAIGSIAAMYKSRPATANHTPPNPVFPICVWTSAFLSIAGAYFDWLDLSFIWVLPAILFTVMGLITSIVYLLRK
jgi:hypothetical protein